MNNLQQDIVQKIEKGEPLSPFLFLGSNLEVLNSEIESLAKNLLKEYSIDINSFFTLTDQGESIKIEEMRNFLNQGNTKPRFKFQIFFIENISRMTLQSANASLKFFEEPGVGNIIFLTNSSEADVLDTIVSRVQIVRSHRDRTTAIRQEYYSMIEKHIESGDIDLVSYFYTSKLEKNDYQDFLKAFLSYIGDSGACIDLIDELEKDIQGLEKNNLNGKYVVDKYLGSI